MVSNPLPEHKRDAEAFIRFEPTAAEGRVAVYQSVESLVERFQGSRFALCEAAPIELCVRGFLADLGGTVDAAGFQRLLNELEATR